MGGGTGSTKEENGGGDAPKADDAPEGAKAVREKSPDQMAILSRELLITSKAGLKDRMLHILKEHTEILNVQDSEGKTCVHHTAEHSEGLEELLAIKEARTDITDKYGDVPLHCAAQSGCPMSAYLLSRRDPHLCLAKNNANQTPIQIADNKKLGEVLNAMLLACCSEEANQNDASPQAFEAIENLLQAGAVPDTWAPNGNSALMMASIANSPKTIRILLEHKAQINMKDTLGRTALMFAAGNGAEDAVLALLEIGGQQALSLRDNKGSNALQYANTEGTKRVLQEKLDNLEKAALENELKLLADLDAEADDGGGKTKSSQKASKKKKKGKSSAAVNADNQILASERADEPSAIQLHSSSIPNDQNVTANSASNDLEQSSGDIQQLHMERINTADSSRDAAERDLIGSPGRLVQGVEETSDPSILPEISSSSDSDAATAIKQGEENQLSSAHACAEEGHGRNLSKPDGFNGLDSNLEASQGFVAELSKERAEREGIGVKEALESDSPKSSTWQEVKKSSKGSGKPPASRRSSTEVPALPSVVPGTSLGVPRSPSTTSMLSFEGSTEHATSTQTALSAQLSSQSGAASEEGGLQQRPPVAKPAASQSSDSPRPAACSSKLPTPVQSGISWSNIVQGKSEAELALMEATIHGSVLPNSISEPNLTYHAFASPNPEVLSFAYGAASTGGREAVGLCNSQNGGAMSNDQAVAPSEGSLHLDQEPETGSERAPNLEALQAALAELQSKTAADNKLLRASYEERLGKLRQEYEQQLEHQRVQYLEQIAKAMESAAQSAKHELIPQAMQQLSSYAIMLHQSQERVQELEKQLARLKHSLPFQQNQAYGQRTSMGLPQMYLETQPANHSYGTANYACTSAALGLHTNTIGPLLGVPTASEAAIRAGALGFGRGNATRYAIIQPGMPENAVLPTPKRDSPSMSTQHGQGLLPEATSSILHSEKASGLTSPAPIRSPEFITARTALLRSTSPNAADSTPHSALNFSAKPFLNPAALHSKPAASKPQAELQTREDKTLERQSSLTGVVRCSADSSTAWDIQSSSAYTASGMYTGDDIWSISRPSFNNKSSTAKDSREVLS